MTDSLTTTESVKAAQWPPAMARRILFTRLALLFEQVWPRLWPAMGIAGVFLVLSLWDTWLQVPGIIHAAALTGLIGWTAFSLWQKFKSFKWPNKAQVLRRLEQDNKLDHRPLSAFEDVPAKGSDGDPSQSLWRHHRGQIERALEGTQVHLPKSDLPDKDPHALRALILLLLIPSFFVAGDDWQERLRFAFQPQLSWTTPIAVPVEAWITPPGYTQIAPIFLTSSNTAPSQSIIEIPANSLLTAQISSRQRGSFDLESTADSTDVVPEEETQKAVRLDADQSVRLSQNGRQIGAWDFRVIPDRPPAIVLTQELRTTIRSALEMTFAIRDDYGVVSAAALISPTEREGELLSLPLGLPSDRPERVDETNYHDLTAHPWAGLDVDLQLIATDEIGQIGKSEVYQTRLPERQFIHPLAKAIIEQRRNLALDPTAWQDVAMALDALAFLSEDLAEDYTLYLGLRSAYWSLVSRAPTRMSEIEDVYGLLWDLALRLEEGDVAEAEEHLRTTQQELMEALANGADRETLERLFAEYNAALNRYLAALSERAMEADRTNQPTQASPNMGELRSQDLAEIIESIEQMAATGDLAEARRMLGDLQRMLENLSAGAPSPLPGQQAQTTEAIEELSEILRGQRHLLDETFSSSAGQSSRPPVEQGPIDGDPASGTTEQTPLQGLAQDQEGLGGRLEALRRQLQELMPEADGLSELEDAQEAMGRATQSLEQNYGAGAQSNQREAIESLSEGANALAQELMDQLSSQGQPQGQSSGNRDPLGRRPGNANSLGDHIKVPDQSDLQRAREILQELQRRAGQTDRPQLELEYLERLLKRF